MWFISFAYMFKLLFWFIGLGYMFTLKLCVISLGYAFGFRSRLRLVVCLP